MDYLTPGDAQVPTPQKAPKSRRNVTAAASPDSSNKENNGDHLQQRIRSQRKKSVVPTPSILDFMSDAEVKRLTRANTRKNIGDRRKGFRTPFSRRRIENFPADDDNPKIPATPVVDHCSPIASSSTKYRPQSSIENMVEAAASPVTPETKQSKSPFISPNHTSDKPGTVTISFEREETDVDMSLDPALEFDCEPDVDQSPSSMSSIPSTKSLAPAYRMRVSHAKPAYSDTALHDDDPLRKQPRSVRICSRVKVVDYLKQRPISPESSPVANPSKRAIAPPPTPAEQSPELPEGSHKQPKSVKRFMRRSSSQNGQSPDADRGHGRPAAAYLFAPRGKVASFLGARKRGSVHPPSGTGSQDERHESPNSNAGPQIDGDGRSSAASSPLEQDSHVDSLSLGGPYGRRAEEVRKLRNEVDKLAPTS